MPPPTDPKIIAAVDNLCKRCDWIHQIYLMRRHLFDDNPDRADLQLPHYEHFFFRIVSVLQEYWIQGVAALHDPAIQRGNENLSLNYFIERVDWDNETRALLVDLRNNMDIFANKMRVARHKFLAHGDLKSILDGAVFGGFKTGEDTTYFENLRCFANTVRTISLSDSFIYDDLVENDVQMFLTAFDRGRIKT